MTIPNVSQTVGDGKLGTVPNVSALVPVIMGVASSGPFTPVEFAGGQFAALHAQFGWGPGVAQAAAILAKGRKCIFIRTAVTTAGENGDVVVTSAGTSVITATGTPNDSYDLVVDFPVGGTIGAAGIKLRYSIDKGKTFSSPIALGTANTYAIPNTSSSLAFAAGTILATTRVALATLEPKWDADDLVTAFTALRAASGLVWHWGQIVGACSATEAATVKSQLETFEAAGKYVRFLGEARRQTDHDDTAETAAAWRDAIVTDYDTFESRRVGVGAGECDYYSPNTNRKQMRPATWPIALRLATIDPARYSPIRVKADANGGALDCDLFDSSGNPIGHNEAVTPGLDTTGAGGTARFMTLRTHATKGRRAYTTRANLMSPAGSDFKTFRDGIVMDLACTATLDVLTDEIGETPKVVKKGERAGKIVEAYAKSIEAACRTRLRNDLLTPGRASDAYVVVELGDDILSTKKVRCKTFVLPLGEVEYLENEVAYYNPAIVAEEV